ncbi:MAG: hypothetical protein HAW60_03375 [Bdellovibrionales bacterium]|nr:hypothetical protein [Bdellovibrionales bacterium]
MTDGAAKLSQIYNKPLAAYFKKFTSRDSKKFISSAQWMTEKKGGSDVRASTETIAKKENATWRLYGEKWFTSAITASVAFTLARIEGKDGLSLFFLETKNKNGKWNNLEICRLKNKLGTNALPTAEIKLKGSIAHVIGEYGNGIKKITPLLNITRLHNSITACSLGKHLHSLSKSFAQQRLSFGKKLIDHPLHKQSLDEAALNNENNFYLTMYAVYLLGLEENKRSTKEQSQILRLLTPVCKLYTAKKNMLVASELLESFGGFGYIEDTGIPRIFRDSQVLSIWEGTANILSLDTLKALNKDQSFQAFVKEVHNILNFVKNKNKEKEKILKKLDQLTTIVNKLSSQSLEESQLISKKIAFFIAEIIIESFRLRF